MTLLFLYICIGIRQPAQQSPFDTLCARFGLEIGIINNEVTDEHILQIYPQLENWKRLALHLGFTHPNVKAIENEAQLDEKLGRVYLLQKWKEKGKINGTATYQVLIKAMLDAECLDSAEKLCKQLTS